MIVERVENIGCHQNAPEDPTKPPTWRPLFGQCGRCERRLVSIFVPPRDAQPVTSMGYWNSTAMQVAAACLGVKIQGFTFWICESCDSWMIKRSPSSPAPEEPATNRWR